MERGTYGVISPLLVNIALHGMEIALTEWSLRAYPKEPTPILVRYANDFVVLHQSKEVIEQAQAFLISIEFQKIENNHGSLPKKLFLPLQLL
jgi:retron-type reverse transcriptase